MDQWLLAVTSDPAAKGSAKDLEVAGAGPVHCRFSIPPSFLTMCSSERCLSIPPLHKPPASKCVNGQFCCLFPVICCRSVIRVFSSRRELGVNRNGPGLSAEHRCIVEQSKQCCHPDLHNYV